MQCAQFQLACVRTSIDTHIVHCAHMTWFLSFLCLTYMNNPSIYSICMYVYTCTSIHLDMPHIATRLRGTADTTRTKEIR